MGDIVLVALLAVLLTGAAALWAIMNGGYD